MNLELFARVLWRFKYVVAGGFVVALLLAVLTVAKLPSFKPRTTTVYGSSATLLITQSGFPWGSAVQQYALPGRKGQDPVPAGDLTRLTALANLYVQLANSDVIKRRRGAEDGGLDGSRLGYAELLDVAVLLQHCAAGHHHDGDQHEPRQCACSHTGRGRRP